MRVLYKLQYRKTKIMEKPEIKMITSNRHAACGEETLEP